MIYVYINNGIIYATSPINTVVLDKECAIVGVDEAVYDNNVKQEYKALATYWHEVDEAKEQTYLNLLDIEMGVTHDE